MKKTFFLILCLQSVLGYAKELVTFSDIATSVAQGEKLVFVVNVKECTADMPLTSAVFSIQPDAIMVVNNKRITFSNRHFSLDDPNAQGEPVFDYSKFNLDTEGNALIKITMMSAQNYEKLASYRMNCGLGKGIQVFS